MVEFHDVGNRAKPQGTEPHIDAKRKQEMLHNADRNPQKGEEAVCLLRGGTPVTSRELNEGRTP